MLDGYNSRRYFQSFSYGFSDGLAFSQTRLYAWVGFMGGVWHALSHLTGWMPVVFHYPAANVNVVVMSAITSHF
jgi:hypothetical protein